MAALFATETLPTHCVALVDTVRRAPPLTVVAAHRPWHYHPTMASILINIDVPELEQGIAFYTSAFELRLSRRFDSGFAELVGAEVPIYLLQSPAGSPPFKNADTQRDYARHWTPLHLDLVVPDLEAALARALAAGATQESPPSTHAYGSLVLLSNPFGHGVCLLQFNSQGYDAITDKATVPG